MGFPLRSRVKAGEAVRVSRSTQLPSYSLQCRRILGGRNLVRVRNIAVTSIFDFMTVVDWGE